MTDLSGTEAPKEISAENWRKLMKTYNNDPSQIDGFTAGLAETAPVDGMVGPLFACIIKKQFENLRDGDRFFFSHRRSQEHPRPQGLPDVAKKNIKRRSLGAILCDNLEASILGKKPPVGEDVFRTVSEENQELDCKRVKMFNGQLDLSEIFSEAVTEEGDRLMKDLTSVPNPQGPTPLNTNPTIKATTVRTTTLRTRTTTTTTTLRTRTT